MNIYEQITKQLIRYLESMNWSFIFTFMMIVYALNFSKVKEVSLSIFRCSIKTRYRVLIVGLIYAGSLFFIKGKSVAYAEQLMQSLLFAMIFHQLFIDLLVKYLARLARSPEKRKKDGGS